jgi:hypothetical protein
LKQAVLIFVVGGGEIKTIEAGATDKSLVTSTVGEDIPTAPSSGRGDRIGWPFREGWVWRMICW